MLRLLKEVPTRTLGDISPILGKSERSLQRWWNAYQVGGINGLLDIGKAGGKRPRRIGDEQIEEIREKVKKEGVGELGVIQEWLKNQHNISYSRSGLSHLMRSVVGAQPRGWVLFDEDAPKSGENVGKSWSDGDVGIPPHVVRFLNALPTTGDGTEWVLRFREALRLVLGDIDRISISVNLECDLNSTGSSEVSAIVSQYVGQSEDDEERTVDVMSGRNIESNAQRVLEGMRRQGFPFNEYRPPVTFEYYYQGNAYLGTIIFWREVKKMLISQETVETMKGIEPFLIFALSDLVIRHKADNPVDGVFNSALNEMIADAGLSSQEQRIVILQLMGQSYKEIADTLNVSLDTVKKHFKQIHRKTGTRGQAELFAKYFTSRLRSAPQEEE
jgi:transposase